MQIYFPKWTRGNGENGQDAQQYLLRFTRVFDEKSPAWKSVATNFTAVRQCVQPLVCSPLVLRGKRLRTMRTLEADRYKQIRTNTRSARSHWTMKEEHALWSIDCHKWKTSPTGGKLFTVFGASFRCISVPCVNVFDVSVQFAAKVQGSKVLLFEKARGSEMQTNCRYIATSQQNPNPKLHK